MRDLKVDTAIIRPLDPMRKIVKDIHDYRGPGDLLLECGHLRSKEWGRRYGKSTRCYRCTQVKGWLAEIDEVQKDLEVAATLLAQGKLGEEIYTWNTMSDLHGRLKKTLEKENGTES